MTATSRSHGQTADPLIFDLGLDHDDPVVRRQPSSTSTRSSSAGFKCSCGTCSPHPDSWLAQYRRAATG